MWSASVFDALPNVISDDENSESGQDEEEISVSEGDTTTSEGEGNGPPLTTEPRAVTFAPGRRPTLIPDDTIHLEETVSPQQEYLAWHH